MPKQDSVPPEDICNRTFKFSVRLVRLCQHLDEKPGVGRLLSCQLFRSGTAIGANIEEAQAAQSKADFISKNSIALKEARETLYWIRLLIAADILPESRILELRVEADEIAKVVGAIVVSTRRNSMKAIVSALFPFSFFLFNLI